MMMKVQIHSTSHSYSSTFVSIISENVAGGTKIGHERMISPCCISSFSTTSYHSYFINISPSHTYKSTGLTGFTSNNLQDVDLYTITLFWWHNYIRIVVNKIDPEFLV